MQASARLAQVICKTLSIYLFMAGFQFREEFFLLQLKCDPLVYAREDAAQRLQRFHCRFAVVALNADGLRHKSKQG
jgi:hypothetical protein